MIYEVAPGTIFWRKYGKIIIKPISSTKVAVVDLSLASLLMELSPSTEDQVKEKLHALGEKNPQNVFDWLVECGILFNSTSRSFKNLKNFLDAWPWGPISAASLLGYQIDNFEDDENVTNLLYQKRENIPKLFISENNQTALQLPELIDTSLMRLLSERRTKRDFYDSPISLKKVSNCLYAAFGITHQRLSKIGVYLPFGTNPSPGALNSVDCLLLAKNIADLRAGAYWYAPLDHSLQISDSQVTDGINFGELFGGQDWLKRGACAVLFIAKFERIAWKYSLPSAVNSVLIEIGHKAQSLLLAAQEMNLAATISGLIGVGAFDRKIFSELGIELGELSIPIYAIILGNHAGAGEDEIAKLVPEQKGGV